MLAWYYINASVTSADPEEFLMLLEPFQILYIQASKINLFPKTSLM